LRIFFFRVHGHRRVICFAKNGESKRMPGSAARNHHAKPMEYRELRPPAGTERYVRCLWTLRACRSEAPAPALPDGCPELILNSGDACMAPGPTGALVRQPPCALVGQITRPFAVSPTGSLDLVAIRFSPAGAALLHQPMSSITDC
jgi:hypothetical protein